jgi:FHS family L-fucose permease-like MFS transporter
MGLQEHEVAPYVSLFWASLMIGRWTSAAAVFTEKTVVKRILGILLPYAAFGVFILINVIVKNDITPFKFYGLVIAIMIVLEMLSKGNPAKQLLIFSLAGIAALLTGMFTTGMTSVYSFISVGLFCSTLWPCIFTLAINKLGASTTQGSGFLIMMIMGGGVISLLQGWLAEAVLGIQMSYVVGVICFAYLAVYAYLAPKVTK